jgi:hypothetical protein
MSQRPAGAEGCRSGRLPTWHVRTIGVHELEVLSEEGGASAPSPPTRALAKTMSRRPFLDFTVSSRRSRSAKVRRIGLHDAAIDLRRDHDIRC